MDFDPNSVAAQTLRGDLRDMMLRNVREMPNLWQQLREGQQRDIAHGVDAFAQDFVARAVELITAGDAQGAITAEIFDIRIKGSKVDVKLTAQATEVVVVALMQAKAQPVLLLPASAAAYSGERRPATDHVAPDQPDFMTGVAGVDEPEPMSGSEPEPMGPARGQQWSAEEVARLKAEGAAPRAINKIDTSDTSIIASEPVAPEPVAPTVPDAAGAIEFFEPIMNCAGPDRQLVVKLNDEYKAGIEAYRQKIAKDAHGLRHNSRACKAWCLGWTHAATVDSNEGQGEADATAAAPDDTVTAAPVPGPLFDLRNASPEVQRAVQKCMADYWKGVTARSEGRPKEGCKLHHKSLARIAWYCGWYHRDKQMSLANEEARKNLGEGDAGTGDTFPAGSDERQPASGTRGRKNDGAAVDAGARPASVPAAAVLPSYPEEPVTREAEATTASPSDDLMDAL